MKEILYDKIMGDARKIFERQDNWGDPHAFHNAYEYARREIRGEEQSPSANAGSTGDSREMAGGLKPPLGLRPRMIIDHDRAVEIWDAMVRYKKNNQPVPLKWIDEYIEVHQRFEE